MKVCLFVFVFIFATLLVCIVFHNGEGGSEGRGTKHHNLAGNSWRSLAIASDRSFFLTIVIFSLIDGDRPQSTDDRHHTVNDRILAEI